MAASINEATMSQFRMAAKFTHVEEKMKQHIEHARQLVDRIDNEHVALTSLLRETRGALSWAAKTIAEQDAELQATRDELEATKETVANLTAQLAALHAADGTLSRKKKVNRP